MSGPSAVRTVVSATTRLIAVPTVDVGRTAGGLVADAVRAGTLRVLGVATGSSPLALYADLVARRAEGLATDGLALVALDEYVGLAPDDPRSYTSYVHRVIADPLGVPAERVLVPSGRAPEDAAAVEAAIAALGGVDLQIVGIGRNGHIGFNEPGSDPTSRTHVVELAESTRRDNAAPFGGDPRNVPTHAITQGLGTILSARRIVLVASGEAKAEAIDAALTGPVTPDVPASFLQLHSDVTVVADHAALGGAA
jgi:glucosamine-6-phosphate deaminase